MVLVMISNQLPILTLQKDFRFSCYRGVSAEPTSSKSIECFSHLQGECSETTCRTSSVRELMFAMCANMCYMCLFDTVQFIAFMVMPVLTEVFLYFQDPNKNEYSFSRLSAKHLEIQCQWLWVSCKRFTFVISVLLMHYRKGFSC